MLTAFEINEGARRKGNVNTSPTTTSPSLTRAGTGAPLVATDSKQPAEADLSDTQAHSRRGRGLVADDTLNITQNDGAFNNPEHVKQVKVTQRGGGVTENRIYLEEMK